MLRRSFQSFAALAAIAIAACSTPRGGGAADAPARATHGIASAPFGREGDTPVQLYTLTNRNGLIAKISNYGAIVAELHVPDRTGRFADIVLGFENLDGYLAGHPYFGAIVGRVANRIRNAEFALDGARYTLAAHDGLGQSGLDRQNRGDRGWPVNRAHIYIQGRRGRLSGHGDGEDGLHAYE
jgi:hypothetical protein